MAKGRKTGGRTKGTPNKASGEISTRCKALIESEDYQQMFVSRLTHGTLPPALEALTWHYAYGKPKERVELTGADGGPISYAWQG